MLAEPSELQAYLDVEDITGLDTILGIILTGADAYIRTYCGRDFELERRIRTVDPVDYGTFWVPEFPLTAVHGITAFTYSGDVTGLSCSMAYVSFYEAGKIVSDEQLFCPGLAKSVLVDYTAGYDTDAKELGTLKWICLEVAAQMYRNRGITNIQNYNAGGVQWQKYASDVMPMLGPEVLSILNSFRRVGPRDWI
jgi:uncharacterized phiE125 gp8 family phage protein